MLSLLGQSGLILLLNSHRPHSVSAWNKRAHLACSPTYSPTSAWSPHPWKQNTGSQWENKIVLNTTVRTKRHNPFDENDWIHLWLKLTSNYISLSHLYYWLKGCRILTQLPLCGIFQIKVTDYCSQCANNRPIRCRGKMMKKMANIHSIKKRYKFKRGIRIFAI